MWLRGELNAMKGVDCRGVPVFTAIRKVPGTPWMMVSKIDQDELLAPIRILKNWVIFVAVIFVATGGLLIVAWHQRKQEQSQRLKGQQDAELERMALLKHFEYLTRFGNDIVVLADDEGRIVEANDRAAAAYGYSTEKLKGSIVLSDWDDSLFLTIKDNGKGFDIQQVKAQSFGLAGIRERAVLMNGKAEIISAPGKGTTVRVSMKLGGKAAIPLKNGD